MEKLETRSEVGDTPKEPNAAQSATPAAKKEKNVKWSPENESIMVEWCDTAQCYKWLNSKAHAHLSFAHAWFTIPAITLSTITGTASFAQTSLPIHMQEYAPAIIGTINIFTGILSTVQQYLKISELNEAHRVSAISWDKFSRNIRIELAKDPKERTEAGQFLKFCRMEFDRLMETSPAIPQRVIGEFNSTFQGKPDSVERTRFENLRKPDICNTITSANESRHPWYKTAHLFDEEEQMRETMQIEMTRRTQEKEDEVRRRLEQDKAKLQKYVSAFLSNVGRKPLMEEVSENMKDSVHPDAIDAFKTVL
jgi:hypothetical protein